MSHPKKPAPDGTSTRPPATRDTKHPNATEYALIAAGGGDMEFRHV